MFFHIDPNFLYIVFYYMVKKPVFDQKMTKMLNFSVALKKNVWNHVNLSYFFNVYQYESVCTIKVYQKASIWKSF